MTFKPRRGSTTWLMMCQTSAHLQQMAHHFDPRYIRSEANFIVAVRHAVAYCGITTSNIAFGVGCRADVVEQWVRDCKKLPIPKELRKKVLLFLCETVRKRGEQILLEIQHPPR